MSVVINEIEFWSDWPNGRDTVFDVVAVSNHTWVTAEGELVGAGEPRVVGVGTITALRPTIPQITLPSTSAGFDNQSARWTVSLHRTGKPDAIFTVCDSFALPISFEPSTTWGEIRIYKNNGSPYIWRDTEGFSRTDALNLFNTRWAESLVNASTIVKGNTFLDSDPVVAATPVAVGVNSPKVSGYIYLADSTYGVTTGTGLSSAVRKVNWTGFKAALVAAVAAGKPLVLPPTTVEIEYPSAGDCKGLVTGSLEVFGLGGKTFSKIKIFPDPQTFSAAALFYMSSGAFNFYYHDFSIVGPATVAAPTTAGAADAQASYAFTHLGMNGSNCSLKIHNVDVNGELYEVLNAVSGSGGTADMLIDIEGCDWTGYIQTIACFSVDGETKRLHIRDSHFHDAGVAAAYFSDLPTTPYGHLIYCHGNVSCLFERLRFKNNYYYAVQRYGSPVNAPLYEIYNEINFESGITKGILTSLTNTKGAVITNPVGSTSDNAFDLQNAAVITSPNLTCTGTGINCISAVNNGTTLAADFVINGGKITLTGTGSAINCAYVSSHWRIGGLTVNLPAANATNAVVGQFDACDIEVNGITVNGPTSGTPAGSAISIKKGRGSVSNCTFNNRFSNVLDTQPGAAVLTELVVHDNVFNQSAGYAMVTDNTINGKVRAWNNSFPGASATNYLRSTGFQHSDSLAGVSPTVIASAATVDFTPQYRTHHVSGTANIDNFGIGGNAQYLAAFSGGLIRVIADGACVFRHSIGNIKTNTGANVTAVAGRIYAFEYDASSGYWMMQ